MKSPSVKNESIVWSDAGVWICTKCFQGTDQAEKLKTEFKSRMKDLGRGQNIRVMTSSCLGICPENAQTIVVAPTRGEQKAFVFNPMNDSEEIFQELLKSIKSSAISE